LLYNVIMKLIEIWENPKILGATVIGGAMVFGAYTISNFGQSAEFTPRPTPVIAAELPLRTYIPVVDSNGNGIEDWQEEFLPQNPIIKPAEATAVTYETPTTVTGQISEQFLESIMRAKTSPIVGPSTEEVVSRTADRLREYIESDQLVPANLIKTVPTTPDSIRTYANDIGTILLVNNVSNYDGELTIINRALTLKNPDELKRLIPLASMYRAMRDQAINTPVPVSMAKQHHDLINVFHMLYLSLSDLQLIYEDPTKALLRIQRYRDDSTGLRLALQNVFIALIPYANLFTPNDPAVVLTVFAPNFQ